MIPENPSFLAIDFETANSKRDSACSIGLVRVEKGKITAKEVHLIRPPYTDFWFTHIHGLSWADVENSPDFAEVWAKIEPLFQGVDFIAAHNVGFDRSTLLACMRHYSIPEPAFEYLCTVELARNVWKLFPTKLPDVCRHLGIELQHHEALSDAMACAQIVLAASEHKKWELCPTPAGCP